MKTLAIVAVAGLASAASAQNYSLSIVGAPAQVNSGTQTTFTIDVVGNADWGTHLVGGGFTISNGGDAGIVTDMSGSVAAWAALGLNDGGHQGEGNYDQFVFGQLVFPPAFPPAAGSELGAVIASFQVTIAADSEGVIEFNLGAGSPFSLSIFDGTASVDDTSGALSLGSATINVVPAPSAMALLGLGGLVAGRRRR